LARHSGAQQIIQRDGGAFRAVASNRNLHPSFVSYQGFHFVLLIWVPLDGRFKKALGRIALPKTTPLSRLQELAFPSACATVVPTSEPFAARSKSAYPIKLRIFTQLVSLACGTSPAGVVLSSMRCKGFNATCPPFPQLSLPLQAISSILFLLNFQFVA
jgi:hypothetical protein